MVRQSSRRGTSIVVAQLGKVLDKRRWCQLVLEDWHIDGHLLAASLANVARQAREARVAQENGLRRPEQRLGKVCRTAGIRRRRRPSKVRTAQPRIGGERYADLVGCKVGLQLLPARPHVVLHRVEEGHAAAVGAARGALHHVGPVLGPPHGGQLEAAGPSGPLLLLLLEVLWLGEDGKELLGPEADPGLPGLVVQLDDDVLHLVAPLEDAPLLVLKAGQN